MCPKIRQMLCCLAALVLGALLCAILPGWLMIALLGVCALAAAVFILLRS